MLFKIKKFVFQLTRWEIQGFQILGLLFPDLVGLCLKIIWNKIHLFSAVAFYHVSRLILSVCLVGFKLCSPWVSKLFYTRQVTFWKYSCGPAGGEGYIYIVVQRVILWFLSHGSEDFLGDEQEKIFKAQRMWVPRSSNRQIEFSFVSSFCSLKSLECVNWQIILRITCMWSCGVWYHGSTVIRLTPNKWQIKTIVNLLIEHLIYMKLLNCFSVAIAYNKRKYRIIRTINKCHICTHFLQNVHATR